MVSSSIVFPIFRRGRTRQTCLPPKCYPMTYRLTIVHGLYFFPSSSNYYKLLQAINCSILVLISVEVSISKSSFITLQNFAGNMKRTSQHISKDSSLRHHKFCLSSFRILLQAISIIELNCNTIKELCAAKSNRLIAFSFEAITYNAGN